LPILHDWAARDSDKEISNVPRSSLATSKATGTLVAIRVTGELRWQIFLLLSGCDKSWLKNPAYTSEPIVCFLPNIRIAIGIVLARPNTNSGHPSIFLCSRLNLLASNKPAPNPIAPRVAAINAISGTVTLFASEIFMSVLLTQSLVIKAVS
jgi:hypothetical protein